MIVKIFNSLIMCGIPASEIGIITPYTDQVKLIRQFIESTSVVIGSVDSFQGQERNVILVSTVRSFDSRGIGFVGDKKRLNVTLSRAKAGLIIVGNDVVLKRKKIFRDLFKMQRIHIIKPPKVRKPMTLECRQMSHESIKKACVEVDR